MSKDNKAEMKHSLEDIIVAKVKADLKKKKTSFQIICGIIEDLKQKLV